MKKAELAFTAALVPIDYILVFLAAITAYTLRFSTFVGIRPFYTQIPWSDFIVFSFALATVFVSIFAIAGLYTVTGPRQLKVEMSRIFLATGAAIMAAIVLIFFQGEYFTSRFIVLATWLLAFFYVAFGRITVRLIQRKLLKYGYGAHHIALIGANDRTTELLTMEFARNPGFGYRIHRTYDSINDNVLKELHDLSQKGDIDEIMVSDPDIGRGNLATLLAFTKSRHLGFKYSADLLATRGKNIEVTEIAGVPIVEIKGTRLDGWGRIFKRIFDVVGALILIIVTLPLMIATAIAIKLDSKGPILFTKLDDGTPVTRVGERGKPFLYFKFRSMRPGTHNLRYSDLAHLDTRNEGPLVKIKDDPRITRVGAFIRKYSLDELPELFLVLTGSMSLVGPRPHLPEEVAKYDDTAKRVLTVKPGITGLAQTSGRANLSFDEEVRLDTFYLENWSPWLDLAILLRTPGVVLSKKGAS